MWRYCWIATLIVAVTSIRVPVDYDVNNTTDTIKQEANSKSQPVHYEIKGGEVDSYLVPPDPHKSDESNDKDAPATYLLPPLPDKQSEYYMPESTQSDWYPIIKVPTKLTRNHNNIPKNKAPMSERINYKRGVSTEKYQFSTPSRQLEPPKNDPSEFVITALPEEQQLPVLEIRKPFKVSPPSEEYELPIYSPQEHYNHLIKVPLQFDPVPPTLALYLTPPKPFFAKHKIPTNMYPKKFSSFKPVPIPLGQFAEGSLVEVPKARPMTQFAPAPGSEFIRVIPFDEKKAFNFEKAEHQKLLKEEEAQKQLHTQQTAEEFPNVEISDPEASESNYHHPRGNVYPSQQQKAPAPSPSSNSPYSPAAPAPDQRTEFRMHGMNGPHSYQFGYDTGKGKNRQFRFEERDNDGNVRGHYGYMDKDGKMRVVNYNADPEHGFHAESPKEEEKEKI